MISKIFIISVMVISNISYCSDKKNNENLFNSINLLDRNKKESNTSDLLFSRDMLDAKIANDEKSNNRILLNQNTNYMFENKYGGIPGNNKNSYNFKKYNNEYLNNDEEFENNNEHLNNKEQNKDEELYNILQRNHLNWMNLDPNTSQYKSNNDTNMLNKKEYKNTRIQNNIIYFQHNILDNNYFNVNGKINKKKAISQFSNNIDSLSLDDKNNIIDLDEDNMEAAPVQENSSILYDNYKLKNNSNKKIKHNNRMKQNLCNNNTSDKMLSNNEKMEGNKVIKLKTYYYPNISKQNGKNIDFFPNII